MRGGFKPEHERIQEDFKGKAKEMAEHLNDATKAIKDILAKPNIGKKDREQIASKLDGFVQAVEHNIPFLLDSLRESAEKVVTQAKSEVVAFTENALKKAGLEHLKNQAPQLESK